MKKVGVFVILLVLVFSLIPFILADSTSANTSSSTASSTGQQQDTSKINKAFSCLETKVGDCSKLTTQEIALTILATPKDSVFNDCVKELKSRKSSENWGNIRDTALAILALNHAGEDTTSAEGWLLNQSRTPTKLAWYLQEDSNGATKCTINYQTNGQASEYKINIGDNKKIDQDAGPCLTLANSNFWLQISPSCYDKNFTIACSENYNIALIYKNENSQIIHPLAGTDTAPAFGSINFKLNSKCFGASSCDYEATAWTILTLLKGGSNIEVYIPYLIAMAGTNEQYLPDAFNYMITNYDDYANQLITSQKLGNYWEAQNSVNDRYYDTALALMALRSSSSEKVTKAKGWLFFSQGVNGCWQNSVKDTAMVLWVLANRAGKTPSGGNGNGGGTTTDCSQANFFCIPSSDCPSSENAGDNYYCPSLSTTCCTKENLKSCSASGGIECSSGETCAGNTKVTSDTNSCCMAKCVKKQITPQKTECESNYDSCQDSCSTGQESVPAYACDGDQVCCGTKTPPPSSSGGNNKVIWILTILILVVLGAIGYIYREKIKLALFKSKTKFKKEGGWEGGVPSWGPRPGMPPRPGFPPIRRVPQKIPPRPRPSDQGDKAMSDTFKKLQDMSR